MTTAAERRIPTDPEPERGLGGRELLRFYLPLVLTSQMMTLAVPLINLALTRGEDPQLHLAAYGVCFGLLVFLNAPMLVSRDAGSAMATDRDRWRRLVRLTLAGGAAITSIDLLLGWTPLGDWAFGTVLEATPRVVAEARSTALAMAPIPVLVGLRGLYSALALRAHRTRLLTEATFLRVIVLAVVLALIVRAGAPTAMAVAWALAAGIALETVWIAWVTRDLRTALPERADPTGPRSVFQMTGFVLPLVLSALAWTALRPIVNGFLGRTADGEAAQASFAVLHPLVLLTASALWALQATHQILATDSARARTALRFGIVMTTLCTGLVLALGWSPQLREPLLTRVFTLPVALLDYVEPAMRILFITPFMLGLRACFKGLVLASRRTAVISLSAGVNLVVVFSIGTLALSVFPTANGAMIGIALVTAAEIAETLLLGSVVTRRFGLRA